MGASSKLYARPRPSEGLPGAARSRPSKGVQAEINLEATEWIMEVSGAMHQGFVMTIDYGYTSSALYSKMTGTLACYHDTRSVIAL